MMGVMCHISHHRHRWYEDEETRAPGDVAPRDVVLAEMRDPDLRVSQAERDEVAAALARHFADGRLTVEEYEERVGSALAARTGRDLEPLLSDLPSLPSSATPSDRSQPAKRRPARPPLEAPSLPSPRVIAVAAVVVLAVVAGPWALWLLWPALVMTGGCRVGGRHHSARADVGSRADTAPPVDSVRL
jgi:hypothetical protein